MLFSEALLDRIADDPISGVIEALDLTRREVDFDSLAQWTAKEYDYLLEAMALVEEVRAAGLLNHSAFPPDITGSLDDCPLIFQYLDGVINHCQGEKGKLQFFALRSRFSNTLRSTFSYRFSEGDVARVQQLLNELRELISASPLFDPAHQRRLILRLEKLQAEMHKRVSDLDKFWGLVGDAGVAVGKFGSDAKPIFDRVREITGIVWRTQARAEELPSDTPPPLLAAPDKTGSDQDE